jgi:DNA-binding protein H-NS
MAKVNLASMSVDQLLKLRDEIITALTRKATELQQQLSRLSGGAAGGASGRGRRGPRKGHKVPPKYRGPGGETWSGRGLRPRWLAAALKGGRKLDDFLIGKGSSAKSGRRRKTR